MTKIEIERTFTNNYRGGEIRTIPDGVTVTCAGRALAAGDRFPAGAPVTIRGETPGGPAVGWIEYE